MSPHLGPAIEVSGLSKVYKAPRREPVIAVDDLNLTIRAGQVFGFLGANGAGKTTTIKMMCGLVKPSGGTIRLNGFDVEKERGKAMRQIGAVLEGTRNVYWRLTALENVLYFGRLKGVRGRVLHERAGDLLNELDLWDRRADKVRTFSRGMQQKVAIACALISDPPIVLLDEPTLGLDVKAALTIKGWIARLSQERGRTIVLTTHQLDLAQQLCDQVAIINQGRLLTNSPTVELLGLFRQEYYEIKVKGRLDGQSNLLAPHFGIQQENGDVTVLAGALHTQAELYEILDQIRTAKLTLISVTPVEPNLEEIFIKYMEQE